MPKPDEEEYDAEENQQRRAGSKEGETVELHETRLRGDLWKLASGL
jgi:hypothetical protein